MRPGIRVLFVGINPGLRSAALGHHFAGRSNRFWKLLFDARLVPEPVGFEDDGRLPEWGYGLTNLVGRPTRGVGDLTPAELRGGRAALEAKIRRLQPAIVALVGVTVYRAMFGHGCRGAGPGLAARRASRRRRRVRIGLQARRLAGARVFLLPNPSGRNAHFSYPAMRRAFRALRRHLAR